MVPNSGNTKPYEPEPGTKPLVPTAVPFEPDTN